MKRLGVVLPEWTRTMWSSEEAKAAWQPRIDAINGAWTLIERWSVVEGTRGSCLTFAEPEDLPEVTQWAAKNGLVVLPMAQVGSLGCYSATPQAVTAGERWQYRIALTRPEFVDAWLEAWNTGRDASNDEEIGKLLGFPECCRAFFRRIWVDEKFLDTTWPMAVNSGYSLGDDLDRLLEVGGVREVKIPELPIEANILLRWLGVRLVTHLPCAFNCKETIERAKVFEQVGRDHGFGDAMGWTREMLAWPLEWSALHGIAEIKTPVLKISSRTDMTAQKYVVQKWGSGYPDEGAIGLRFPYKTKPDQVQLTKTPAFARAFANMDPRGDVVDDEPIADLWTDNGFGSFEAMNDAHTVLLEAAQLEQLEAGAQVLDLGCGNGRLLERVGEVVPGLELYGIELDPARCRRAGERIRRNGGTEHAGPAGRRLEIYHGSMFDPEVWGDLQPELVFLMPGRLLESKYAGEWAETLRGLLRLCERVVFYAYGDWLEKGGILELVAKAGLDGWEKVGTVVHAPNAEAILANRC